MKELIIDAPLATAVELVLFRPTELCRLAREKQSWTFLSFLK
jgi:hypothetical protein